MNTTLKTFKIFVNDAISDFSSVCTLIVNIKHVKEARSSFSRLRVEVLKLQSRIDDKL